MKLWSWVKDNIFLPKELIAEIERERAALKAKASGKKSGRDRELGGP
jgi:hypothetical protein